MGDAGVNSVAGRRWSNRSRLNRGLQGKEDRDESDMFLLEHFGDRLQSGRRRLAARGTGAGVAVVAIGFLGAARRRAAGAAGPAGGAAGAAAAAAGPAAGE